MSQSFSDTQLAAFLDGTLEDDALVTAIEAAINADPSLADRVEAISIDNAAAEAVRGAFAPVLQAPVPDRLVLIVEPAARAERRPRPEPANDTGWRWPQFAAMAASLALGVMIGGTLLKGGSTGDPGSLVLSSADVTSMLDTAPSGQNVDLASLGSGEVVLSFRGTGGQLCRQFTVKGKGGTTSDALACAGPSDSGWQIEAYGRRATPAGEMKLAAGDAAPAVVAAVDAIIDSDPLLGSDEAAALGRK